MQNKYEKLRMEDERQQPGSLYFDGGGPDIDLLQKSHMEAAIELRRRFENALLFFRINSAKVEIMLE